MTLGCKNKGLRIPGALCQCDSNVAFARASASMALDLRPVLVRRIDLEQRLPGRNRALGIVLSAHLHHPDVEQRLHVPRVVLERLVKLAQGAVGVA